VNSAATESLLIFLGLARHVLGLVADGRRRRLDYPEPRRLLGNTGVIFEDLKDGLTKPLAGMALPFRRRCSASPDR